MTLNIRELCDQAGVHEDVLRRLCENEGCGLSDHGLGHAAKVRALVAKLRGQNVERATS
jgi:hypothetical protein